MPGPVSAGGLGSGFADFFATVVDSLVQRDQEIFGKALQKKEMGVTSLISAYGTLKGAITDFRQSVYTLMDPGTFGNSTVTSSEPTLLTATAINSVGFGEHKVVVNAYAQEQISYTSTYSTPDTTSVGGGTLAFTAGNGSSFAVSFNAGEDNLENIASLINDNWANTFVKAVVQKVDNPMQAGEYSYRLTLISKNTGTDYAFNLVATENPSGSGLNSFNSLTTTAATNAQIILDGGQITESSNTISDAIPGLTMTIIPPTGTGNTLPSTVTLDISANTGGALTAVQNFIGSYNTFVQTLSELGKIGRPVVDQGDIDSSGPLSKSVLILNLEDSLRDFGLAEQLGNMGIGYTSNSNRDVPQLTLMTNSDGSLVISSLLSKDLQGVITAFTDPTTGIGQNFKEIAWAGVKDTEMVIDKELEPKLKDIKKAEKELDEKLDKLKTRLRSRFISLDPKLSWMNNIKQVISNWSKSSLNSKDK